MDPNKHLEELGEWLGSFYKGLRKHNMDEYCAFDLTVELLRILSDKVMEVEE